ncbi:MAG: glycolate oxidase subunit GlcE [Gammaproteobacteria bacterium]|nr:glycolate oxidase subunit GlcE [Gammaproteobacteria bacterium]
MSEQDQDNRAALLGQVERAKATGTPLCIRGGGSKDFYGRQPVGELLDVSQHQGIVNYEPTELVITARAGTPLRVIDQALTAENQMLPFEPPHFGETATLGGTIACNLSGPRRPYAGAARDFVLGSQVLNGKAEILHFGGEVMKNVAGYDVSRLMCGALGTLGVLLEVSLKVLPRLEHEVSLTFELGLEEALENLHTWGQRPYPITATCYDGDQLRVRLGGEEQAVRAAHKRIGGDALAEGAVFWGKLREQQHGFFGSSKPLWRISLASDAAPLDLEGKWLYEWGGAQRWLASESEPTIIREAMAKAGGHATLFRNGDRTQVFQPLPEGLLAIHRRLKTAFDPQGLFNPGRMYEGL